MSKAQEQIDAIMAQAQVFASAWSLVGGPFDSGQACEDAGFAKHELFELVTAALETASSEQQAAQQDAERYQWLLEQAWFQAAFDRFEPEDGGMQKKFVEECARIIDAARASNGGKA